MTRTCLRTDDRWVYVYHDLSTTGAYQMPFNPLRCLLPLSRPRKHRTFHVSTGNTALISVSFRLSSHFLISCRRQSRVQRFMAAPPNVLRLLSVRREHPWQCTSPCVYYDVTVIVTSFYYFHEQCNDCDVIALFM